MSEYFSLATRLLLAFGVIFEMPIFMVFLAKTGLIDVAFLNRNRKYAILIDFIVAAILTPTPDVVNQMMMAMPLMVLYEISVVAVWIFARKGFAGFGKPLPDSEKILGIKEFPAWISCRCMVYKKRGV